MATLKGQSIAASYQDLVKRADTYSQTGTNIELMDDSGDVQATGLYLESGATTDNVGIGGVPTVAKLEIHGGAYNTSLLIKGSGANTGIKFVDSGGNVDGYIYANGETIGFLDSGENYMVKCDDTSGSENIELSTDNTTRMKLDANSRISLSNNDSGTDNTVFGFLAGAAGLSGGTDNVLIGDYAGNAMTSADHNIAIGADALLTHTTGGYNIAIGTGAMKDTNAGSTSLASSDNTFIGFSSASGTWTDVASNFNVAVGNNTMDAAMDGALANTAIGTESLSALTSGDYNTAIGYQTGVAITKGRYNTIIGKGALKVEDVGDETTAVGVDALGSQNSDADNETTGNTGVGKDTGFYNVTGQNNTWVGFKAGQGASGQSNSGNTGVGQNALLSITDGTNNVAVGMGAGDSITTGDYNVFLGQGAGAATTDVDFAILIGQGAGGSGNMDSGADNTIAIGGDALIALTSGTGNIAIGKSAQAAQTDGARNIAIGYEAMDAANSGETENIAIGFNAMKNMDNGGSDRNICIGNYTGDGMGGIAGNDNIFMGYACGSNTWANTTSHTNVAIGNYAMNGAMDACSENTCIGYGAGNVLDNGDSNVMIGVLSGDATTTGYQNVFVGGRTDANIVGGVNQVVIGYNQTGVGNNTAIIGNSSCTDVYMGDDGNAWSQVSDERLKRNIEDWNVGLDAINKLRIRQFQFKDDNPFGFTPDKVRQGVVAQEAIEALPEMIRTNEEGWMSANNESMIWAMVNAIKQLSAKVEELEEKLK